MAVFRRRVGRALEQLCATAPAHHARGLFLQPDDLVVGKGCLDRPRPEALDAEALVHERGAILAQGVLPGIVEGR